MSSRLKNLPKNQENRTSLQELYEFDNNSQTNAVFGKGHRFYNHPVANGRSSSLTVHRVKCTCHSFFLVMTYAVWLNSFIAAFPLPCPCGYPCHYNEQYIQTIDLLRKKHSRRDKFDMHLGIAIPATLALIYRAYSRRSLTPLGILFAAITAVVHFMHPWALPFGLLGIFFLAGTMVTKVKHEIKATLTLSATGASGGEGPRTHIQVLANSLCASVLTLLHTWQLWKRQQDPYATNKDCWAYGNDLLVVGIISNYAAVAADTFSSELGILSKSKPRLLTSWTFRTVPPGTNGGISLTGTLAGFLGAFVIAFSSYFFLTLTFCPAETSILGGFFANGPGFEGGTGWTSEEMLALVAFTTVWGGLGSLLDSALGGWFQESVVDSRTGKVVEGSGGRRVLVKEARVVGRKRSDEPGRRVESGLGLLDNNAVNFLMAAIMSVGGMAVVGACWGVPLSSIFT